MRDVLAMIEKEHRDLRKVLVCLEEISLPLARGDAVLDPDLLRSALYYIRTFPERAHHPKEERYLFRPLERRFPKAATLLADLRDDHRSGETRINHLEEVIETGTAAKQSAAISGYLAFQRDHMEREETEILPLARAHLAASDWRELSRAFQRNQDPMFGDGLQAPFMTLRDRIVSTTLRL